MERAEISPFRTYLARITMILALPFPLGFHS